MSRERDRARVVMEILGEWFGKGLEPALVADGLMLIDSSLLPITDVKQIPEVLTAAAEYARQGEPIRTKEGQAWLQRVLEEALLCKRTEAELLEMEKSIVADQPEDLANYARRRMDHYDCLDVGDDGQYELVRLFGRTNIGNLELTSIQVMGMLESTEAYTIDHWYARTDARGDDLVALEQWAEGANAILNVGDHPVWIRPLSVLLRERPWVPLARRGEVMTEEEIAQFVAAGLEGAVPVLVPIRQHMDISVGLPKALAPVKARIWIHVEGVTYRPIQ